jgi:phosphoribosylaminoimidazole-succinocarboxamide synthase
MSSSSQAPAGEGEGAEAIYKGKVRDIYTVNGSADYLLMEATDRISAFDRNIGSIPGKGQLLNKMSEFWFNNTSHIIDNHLIGTDRQYALVKKCRPFKIEVVVRAYITGNTSTSLWTHYKNGARTYCGIDFPDGLIKNQKLAEIVITPTTKGETDHPITKEQLIEENYMDAHEWDFISTKALELFKFGQQIADKAGFILVDTKYEFGRTNTSTGSGQIILIDEVHTCDSSRYWIKDTYDKRMQAGEEPDKIDKDCVRDWLKANCADPYDATASLPEIPQHIIDKAYTAYNKFYEALVQLNINRRAGDLAIIIAGSTSDQAHIKKLEEALTARSINSQSIVASAHKNTQMVINLINKFNLNRRIIWITVAGRSNALSGVVAANSVHPVIACPPFADKMDMMVNIHSTLQCPSNVPVMTILEPSNVAISVERIFNL